MPARQLIAKIHIAKNQLGMDDEVYRQILSSEFGVSSSKDLDNRKAIKLIKYFESKGFVPNRPSSVVPRPSKKYDDQKGDTYSASPAQKRLIEVLWHNLYRGNDETKHLRQFLFTHFKVSDIRFLDKGKAYDAIEALKNMTRRRGDSKTRDERTTDDGRRTHEETRKDEGRKL